MTFDISYVAVTNVSKFDGIQQSLRVWIFIILFSKKRFVKLICYIIGIFYPVVSIWSNNNEGVKL